MNLRTLFGKKNTAKPVYADAVAQAAVQNSTQEEASKKSGMAIWLWRLLKISPFGVLRLAFLSTLIGFFMMAVDVQENPQIAAPGFWTYAHHVGGLAVQAANWAIRNFWQPALLGGSVVIPVWLIWRFLTLPFRK